MTMPKIKSLHLLKVWSPKTLKIRSRFFFRSQILLGSDRSANFRVAELEGLAARLDLDAGEVTHLADGRVDTIEPDRIVELGDLALQWKVIPLWQKKWIWPVSILCLGLSLMEISGFEVPKEAPCSEFASHLNQGRWGFSGSANEEQHKILSALAQMRTSFQSAMKTRHMVVARAELQGMKELIDKIPYEKGCDVSSEIERLETKYSQMRIQAAIKENQFLEAAEEFGRLASGVRNRKVDRIEKRLRRIATDLYIKGYQLEDADPERAEDLMDQAERICVALKFEPDCYRGKTSTQIVRGSNQRGRVSPAEEAIISDE